MMILNKHRLKCSKNPWLGRFRWWRWRWFPFLALLFLRLLLQTLLFSPDLLFLALFFFLPLLLFFSLLLLALFFFLPLLILPLLFFPLLLLALLLQLPLLGFLLRIVFLQLCLSLLFRRPLIAHFFLQSSQFHLIGNYGQSFFNQVQTLLKRFGGLSLLCLLQIILGNPCKSSLRLGIVCIQLEQLPIGYFSVISNRLGQPLGLELRFSLIQ